MYILTEVNDIINEISIYRLALIIKYAINITLIVVPIIIIILCMIDMSKVIFKPDNVKTSLKTVVNRIIAGLIIFLIPTIIDFCFTLVENYDNSTILGYYNNTSIEKIKELEEEYEIAKVAEKNKENAELQDALLKQYEADKKRAEQLEKIKEKYQPADSNGSYSGDTVSNGTYGSVEVVDGVFYLPNKRPTSDSDIPKQSGEYGLNPIFWERLSALISDAQKQGYTITVTSGWRSYSSQLSLWNNSTRPCNERGNWVACPGGSRHGFGIAADLSFNGTSCSGGWDCNSAATWVHANAANYGLNFRMSWEPWHIEPAQITGGSFGSCTASC